MTIWVSTGLPKAVVPTLVGQQSTDAVAALTQLHLKPDVHEVPSSKPAGEVTAQDPPAGHEAHRRADRCGSTSRRGRSRSPCRASSACRSTRRPRRCRRTASRSARASSTARPAGEHRHRPEPAGRRRRRARARRLADGLEGAEDLDGAGRDELRRRLGRADARRPPASATRSSTRTSTDPNSGRRRARARRRRAARRQPPKTVVTLTVGRVTRRRHDDDGHDDDHPVSRRLRVALLAGGRSSEHDISLALGPLGARGARSRALRRRERRDRPRRPVEPRARPADTPWCQTPGRVRRRRCPSRPRTGRSPRSAPSTSCCRSCTGRSARTGRCRACSSSPASRTSAPGVAASALAMDKDLFKKVLRDSGIPVARHHAIRLGDPVENPFGYPVFVKPARLGSSVGISKVHDASELEPAVALARRHDEKVLVEEFVDGHGGRVRRARQPRAAADRVASRAASTRSSTSGTTSSRSTTTDGMELVIPPELPQETIELVQQRAVDAFVACECEGLARVDFFVRASDGEVIVNELNTMPGLHRDERVREAVRGVGRSVRASSRPADRARARAARAARRRSSTSCAP